MHVFYPLYFIKIPTLFCHFWIFLSFSSSIPPYPSLKLCTSLAQYLGSQKLQKHFPTRSDPGLNGQIFAQNLPIFEQKRKIAPLLVCNCTSLLLLGVGRAKDFSGRVGLGFHEVGSGSGPMKIRSGQARAR